MASIGAGWVDGAWIEAGWTSGSWNASSSGSAWGVSWGSSWVAPGGWTASIGAIEDAWGDSWGESWGASWGHLFGTLSLTNVLVTTSTGTVGIAASGSISITGTEITTGVGILTDPSYLPVQFYYKRNTSIYVSKASNALADASNTVKLTVKDFSYNQNSRVDRVSRDTLSSTQARTISPYVGSVTPVTFNIVTYVLPLVDTNVTSPEENLWIGLMGVDSLTSNPTNSTIDFANGNVSELQNLTLWFDQATRLQGTYRLDNCIIDSAELSFDINGIAEISWSGRALSIVEDNTPPAATDRTALTNYIKNRPSTISLNMNSVNYLLALTGGSIKFDNKNTFYGRNRLGQTTVAEGHFTGNREVSGELDFYMKSGTYRTVELFNEILDNAANTDYETTHLALITIDVGGVANTPRITFTIPQALLEIGNQDFGELYKVSVPFSAKEETGNYISVTYTA